MRDRSQLRRRPQTRLLAAIGLLGTLLVTAGPSPAALLPGSDAPRAAYISPDLLGQVAAGPATAIVAYDRATTSAAGLIAHLAARGVQARAFEKLPVAYACVSTASMLQAIASAPGARSVYGDAPLLPSLAESTRTAFDGDPTAVWNGLGVTGKGVGIAVLDTGVDATHPDLQLGVRTKRNIRMVVSHREILGPYQDPCVDDTFTPELPDTELTSGHGTHMASVAAGDGISSGGQYRGVAPAADIMGIAVSETVTPRADVDAVQTRLSLLTAIAGMNYVLLNGTDGGVVNVRVVLAGWVQEGLYDPWHPMAMTLWDMANFGINVVMPVGNAGPEPSDCSAAATCHINTWSASDPTITVAATPKRSRTSLEPYSSRGDEATYSFRDETFSYMPTLAAPGTGVVAARRVGASMAPTQIPGSLAAGQGDGTVSLEPRYTPLTGTSVAAAHVAGAIALMQEAAFKQYRCYMSPWQVTNLLERSATPMPGHSVAEVGSGMINVTRAVQMAGSWPPGSYLC